MSSTIEVTITVKRNGAAKTWALAQAGESKGGNYLLFQSKDNADIPDFGKLYLKAKRVADKTAKK